VGVLEKMTEVQILNTDRSFTYLDAEFNDAIFDWLASSTGGEYSLGGHGIYFYDEKDATMFILRWS
jgi:hypothetical protein